MTRSIVTSALVVSLAGCSWIPGLTGNKQQSSTDRASAPSPAPDDFFPLVEGATWTYKRYTYDFPEEIGRATFNGTESYAMLSVEMLGKQATASMRQTEYDSSGKETSSTRFLYVVTDDGVYDGTEPLTRRLLFPIPLSTGTLTLAPLATTSTNTVESTASPHIMTVNYGGNVQTTTGTIRGCASIEDFQTLVIKTKATGVTVGSTSSAAVFLAPNVGIAKRRSVYVSTLSGAPFVATSVSELSTYSIPAKP